MFGGVYAFFETHGFPLETLLADMWEREALPDWVDLIRSMVKGGRRVDRAFVAVRTAIDDACYPPDVRSLLQEKLTLLEARWGCYAV